MIRRCGYIFSGQVIGGWLCSIILYVFNEAIPKFIDLCQSFESSLWLRSGRTKEEAWIINNNNSVFIRAAISARFFLHKLDYVLTDLGPPG